MMRMLISYSMTLRPILDIFDYTRHAEMANVLFADGHCDGFTESEMKT